MIIWFATPIAIGATFTINFLKGGAVSAAQCSHQMMNHPPKDEKAFNKAT